MAVEMAEAAAIVVLVHDGPCCRHLRTESCPPITDHAHGQPARGPVEATEGAPPAPRDWSKVTPEERRARMRQLRNAPKIADAQAMPPSERRRYLGTGDNGFSQEEADCGAALEQRFGWFERSKAQEADWVGLSGPYADKTFDHIGLSPGAAEHQQASMTRFLDSLAEHVDKADYVILDLRFMTAEQRNTVMDYIEKKLPGAMGKIFPVERL
jgi:CdiA C-terminal tRNase domain